MKKFLWSLAGLAVAAGAAYGVWRGTQTVIETMQPATDTKIPTTTVHRGRVTITVTSKGDLQGGNSELLMVPSTGVGDVAITYLRPTGDVVQPGDTIVEFDTTQAEYNLREAEADMAEAEQKVLQAESDAKASLEDARYATLSAQAAVELAALEVRKNPLLAANVARQNDISMEAAKNRKAQADRDYANRQASSDAGINIQRANTSRSKLLIDNARRNIANMVLKSKTGGYVHVFSNTSGQLLYTGAVVPDFQVGDMVRTGQTIAQIPDMSSWEVRTNIPEIDRGYMEVGQPVRVEPPVLAGRSLKGHVKTIGATTGYGSNRRFEARIALDETHPALRPGMSVYLEVTVSALDNVLWLPSQAIYEEQGRAFVYVQTPQGFIQQTVKQLRRGESQTVIEGLEEGAEVALTRPDQQSKGGEEDNSVMKALNP